MKSQLKLLSFIALLSISTAAIASKATTKKSVIHGRVESVDGTNITIIAKGVETVIKTDDNTKFFLDDKPATLADVKPRERLISSPEVDAPATEIRLMSAKSRKSDVPATEPASDAK